MTGWTCDVTAELGELRLEVQLDGADEPCLLIGPNGSGKSSLLRVIAGLHTPVRAAIEVAGRSLAELPVEARGIGYVPQGYALFDHLDVLDNVAFGLTVGGQALPREEARQRARESLEAFACGHLASRMPATLSGGEKQRVAVTRALAIKPRLLLLDEPLAALDATARRSVRAFLVTHLRELGCPSLIVTHEPRDVLALGGRVAVLDAGKIVQRGHLDELRASPANDFVREFVADLATPGP